MRIFLTLVSHCASIPQAIASCLVESTFRIHEDIFVLSLVSSHLLDRLIHRRRNFMTNWTSIRKLLIFSIQRVVSDRLTEAFL